MGDNLLSSRRSFGQGPPPKEGQGRGIIIHQHGSPERSGRGWGIIFDERGPPHKEGQSWVAIVHEPGPPRIVGARVGDNLRRAGPPPRNRDTGVWDNLLTPPRRSFRRGPPPKEGRLWDNLSRAAWGITLDERSYQNKKKGGIGFGDDLLTPPKKKKKKRDEGGG